MNINEYVTRIQENFMNIKYVFCVFSFNINIYACIFIYLYIFYFI